MEWVTVQLASWAKSKLSTAELEKAVRKKIHFPELLIYYPVIEDRYGKKDSPYSEYIFLTYHEDLDYTGLEELDEFLAVLKIPKKDQPLTIPDEDVAAIRNQVNALDQLHVDDVAKIMEGPLKGNFGVITGTYAGEATLLVTMGSETIQACISIQHLRFSKKRTLIRKKKLDQTKFLQDFTKQSNISEPVQPNLVIQTETKVEVESQPSSDHRIQRIVRRGLKNTRVLINGQSVLLTNEELRKRLAGSDPVPED